MNRLGLLLAVTGLALGVWVVAAQDLSAVFALLGSAGFGLVLVALLRVPPMAVNAWAWAVLMPGRQRPSLPAMTHVVWVRESVNTLLPVGRVGGEVASYRLLRARGVGVAPAAGGLLLDVALSLISQLLFALLGLALLALATGGALAWAALAGGLLLGFALAFAFVAAQRMSLVARTAGALNRVAQGRLPAVVENSARVDAYTRRAWRRPRAIALCTLWQFAGWAIGALEIYAALWLLGAEASLLDALAIEALIQAVASAAFLVPGALGVQEAGFVGIGALVGLDPATAAALALARRLRDIVVYLPGLAAWAWEERRISRRAAARTAPPPPAAERAPR